MHGTRAHIAGYQRPRSPDLPLDIEVPVQNIRSMRILVDVTISDGIRSKTDVRIDAISQCRVVIKSNDLKRSRSRGVHAEFGRLRQHIKYREAATHGRFPVLERIPRESDSRLEVFSGRVISDKGGDMLRTAWTAEAGRNSRCGAVHEGGDFLNPVVGISGQRCEFIAQADVKCQVRPETPIILNIARKQTLPDSHLIRSARCQRI